MYDNFKSHLVNQLNDIHQDGLYKIEREITSPQGAIVNIQEADNLINLCSNNYLGLAENTEIKEAAKIGLDNWGYGMASVRFICGTQSLHKELEIKLSKFVGMEDTILYPSCFDANAGLYETILGNDDAVISDALNHASIIDGIRLCKASRYRYKNNDMDDLENQLKTAASNGARYKLITTDGVFFNGWHNCKTR
jgi:glycine C-acetyltransferase